MVAGYGVALGVHDLAGRILWAKVQHLGIAMMPASAVAFALRYTGYTRWLTRRNIALVAIVPFVGMLLAWMPLRTPLPTTSKGRLPA